MKKSFYGHPHFYKLLNEMAKIHSCKNFDYAGQKDSLSNFRMSEKMGIPAWKGCLVRMSDKFARLCNFAKQDEFKVKDENVEDTLKDLAIYALICIILYREKAGSELQGKIEKKSHITRKKRG